LLKIIGTDKRSIDTIISHIKDEKTQEQIKTILMFLISMCEKTWALKSEMYSDIISTLMQNRIVKDETLTFNKNIDILTFNYDVSLDIYCKQYVERALYDGKKTLTPNQTQSLRDKITHIYGSLWDRCDYYNNYKYGKCLKLFWTLNSESLKYQDRYEKGKGLTSVKCSQTEQLKQQLLALKKNYFSDNKPFSTSDGFYFFRKKINDELNNQSFRQNSIYLLQWERSSESRTLIHDKYNHKLIQTINHEREAEKFSEYGKKVQKADIIYIMGFGFDKVNCETVLGFDKIKQQRESKQKNSKPWNKKIFYTNYGDVPMINRVVKYYFGDGENVVKSTFGCSETMGREFNFDSEI